MRCDLLNTMRRNTREEHHARKRELAVSTGYIAGWVMIVYHSALAAELSRAGR